MPPNSVNRFIPAGAGTRGFSLPRSRHPGSSPLARGNTRPVRARRSSTRRFIPAGAGNTLGAAAIGTCRPAVHPRWRGEHWKPACGTCSRAGSSPLARGTRRHHLVNASSATVHPRWRGEHRYSAGEDYDGARFIPAGAGTRRTFLGALVTGGGHPRWRGGTLAVRRSCGRESPVHPRWRGERSGKNVELFLSSLSDFSPRR